MTLCVCVVVASAAQSSMAAWLRLSGQPVITGSDSRLNLCEHTPLFSTTLAPWGERNG